MPFSIELGTVTPLLPVAKLMCVRGAPVKARASPPGGVRCLSRVFRWTGRASRRFFAGRTAADLVHLRLFKVDTFTS